MRQQDFETAVLRDIRALTRRPHDAVIHLQVRRAFGAEAACGNVKPDDDLTTDAREVSCHACQLSLQDVAA